MARYVFPSSQSHSPYSGYQQPLVYTTSTPSYGTPIRRHNSFNGHTSPQVYGVSNAAPVYYTPSSHGHAGTQYLVVPGQRSRSRSRSRHGHDHGHTRSHSRSSHYTHGHTASVASPAVVYSTPSAPIYADSGHHRSSSHRRPSHSSHHSHSHHSHSHSHGTNYYSGHQRTPSIGDRVRRMLGFEPSHAHHATSYGDSGRRRHNSFSGHRDESKLHRSYSTRTGPWCFGPTDNRRYVDEHGREVDHRGRVIHRM